MSEESETPKEETKLGPMEKVMAYLGDNSIQIDASEGAKLLEEECPALLQDGEEVVMAFKDRGGKGRDDFFFTSKRIVVRNRMGLTGSKTKYLSVPYKSIKAYSVESAGSMDSDSELKIYGPSHLGQMAFDFVAGKVDIFAIKRFLNRKILTGSAVGEDAEEGAVSTDNVPLPEDGGGNFLDLLCADHTQIDPSEVERQLKASSMQLLLEDETVELAFKCGRDSFLLTSHRMLKIDVQGMSGSRVEYLSILWNCVRAVSIETAGSFDRDTDMMLFTTLPGRTRFELDLHSGKSDVYAVQKFFADKLLGMDQVEVSEEANDVSISSGGAGIMAWVGDDSRMIDASEVDAQYRSNPPILQRSEQVEMAFKGRRDLMIFTTKRLLFVDTKGFSGKRVEYFFLPWKHVQMFAVRSAGSFLDKDSEMMVWTDFDDIFWPPRENEDDPPPPPIPRKSFIEIDFQKDKVDLMAVQRYLSERCLPVAGGEENLPADILVSQDVMESSSPTAVGDFMSWLGDDARAIDPKELDEQLHEKTRALQESENVVLAYKCGRDTVAFTTKRVLIIDVKGFSGKKVLWMSVPYASLRGFAVESAGSWDTDSELRLQCKVYWIDEYVGNHIYQDFRKGSADIIAIQNLLAAMVFGSEDGSSTLDAEDLSTDASSLSNFLSWIGDDGVEISAESVNEKLHSSPPILQEDESAEVCYRRGRDLFIITTKRILLVDVQGFSGKRVEYQSYPIWCCKAFKVQSAGYIGFVSTPKMAVYTDIPGKAKISLELEKADGNIWAMQKMLNRKILGE